VSDVQVDTDAPVAAAAPEPEPAALDGQALIDNVAGEMGWSPKEKWTGDPEKWTDAATFLKNTPRIVEKTKKQVERNARVAAQAMERMREKAMKDAEERIAAAAADGDTDGVREATKELKEASRPVDPGYAGFVARNTWFDTDPVARQVALAAAEKAYNNGASPTEQYAAAEKEVQRRFPEHFEADAPAEKQRSAPSVAGGQRAASATPRQKGWNDLPASVRDANERYFVKKGLLTREEAAAAYWQENQ